MNCGVLVVIRYAELHMKIKEWLEALSFRDVMITDRENEALNTVINTVNPRLLMIDSWFYHEATLFRVGELAGLFPNLNIAVFSFNDFPVSRAPFFIWGGAKSYLNLLEGYDEFIRGLRIVREGKQYISPKVQKLIDERGEWPEIKSKMTKRQRECLIMLCNGYKIKQIGTLLHISRSTVYNHLNDLYKIFHTNNRTDMVAHAYKMRLIDF